VEGRWGGRISKCNATPFSIDSFLIISFISY
jgi:hypothetical protein